jgi:hypothetical protein
MAAEILSKPLPPAQPMTATEEGENLARTPAKMSDNNWACSIPGSAMCPS